MKFPFLKALGAENGWYRVGPLARVSACDFIDTPEAEAERQEFKRAFRRQAEPAHHGLPLGADDRAPARGREDRGAAPRSGSAGQRSGGRAESGGSEAVAVIEAPRGTLFHHYRVDENDQVTMANLIVSTTSNNEPMNRAVASVARRYPGWPADHRGAAEPRRGGDPGLRSLSLLRHARPRADALGSRARRRRGQDRRPEDEGLTARVLVYGYGNPGRGDDGLGPALVRELCGHEIGDRVTMESGLPARDRGCRPRRRARRRRLRRRGSRDSGPFRAAPPRAAVPCGVLDPCVGARDRSLARAGALRWSDRGVRPGDPGLRVQRVRRGAVAAEPGDNLVGAVDFMTGALRSGVFAGDAAVDQER